MAALAWLINLGFAGGGTVSYSLSCEPGSFVVTGTDADLRKIAVDQPSGGYEKVFGHRKKKRFAFPWEEEKVLPIVEDIAQRFNAEPTDDLAKVERDLEIALRIRLRQNDLLYRAVYFKLLTEIVTAEIQKRREMMLNEMRLQEAEEELILQLLLQ